MAIVGVGAVALTALLLRRSPGTTPGYLPNEEIRARFTRLDLESVDRVTVNGFVLDYGETRDVIAALRRSERRVTDGEGHPYRADDHEGGEVSVECALRVEGSHVIVARFGYSDPARHHGPAFARAVAAALRRSSYAAQTEDAARRTGRPSPWPTHPLSPYFCPRGG